MNFSTTKGDLGKKLDYHFVSSTQRLPEEKWIHQSHFKLVVSTGTRYQQKQCPLKLMVMKDTWGKVNIMINKELIRLLTTNVKEQQNTNFELCSAKEESLKVPPIVETL